MSNRGRWVAFSLITLLPCAALNSAQAKAPAKFPPDIIKRFDANGNGRLDPQERKAAVQYMELMAKESEKPAGGQPGAGGPAGRPGASAPGGGMNPQMMQQLLQRFDKNGNGQLDPDEQQAARQYVQQMQGGGGQGPGGRPGAGAPGGGMNPQMMQQLLQRFDKNGNGQLDPDERQAAMQFMQQMQQQGGGPRPNKN